MLFFNKNKNIIMNNSSNEEEMEVVPTLTQEWFHEHIAPILAEAFQAAGPSVIEGATACYWSILFGIELKYKPTGEHEPSFTYCVFRPDPRRTPNSMFYAQNMFAFGEGTIHEPTASEWRSAGHKHQHPGMMRTNTYIKDRFSEFMSIMHTVKELLDEIDNVAYVLAWDVQPGLASNDDNVDDKAGIHVFGKGASKSFPAIQLCRAVLLHEWTAEAVNLLLDGEELPAPLPADEKPTTAVQWIQRLGY